MKKKAIVLLISLFFIAAVTALILKNLKDTDIYIKEYNQKISKVQSLFLLNNAIEEIKKLIKLTKQKPDFELEDMKQVFPIYDAFVQVEIKNYEKYDINILGKNDVEKLDKLQELFFDNQVSDFDRLKQLYSEEKMKDNNFKIKNKKQLDRLLEKFAKDVYNNDIYKIKDKLGFLEIERNEVLKEKDIKDKNYELFIKINYLNTLTKAYLVLSNSQNGEEQGFELSFK